MLGLGTRRPLKKKSVVIKKKAITAFRPQIRSQHPTHDHLRGVLDRVNKRVVVRLGSTTTLERIYPKLTPQQRNNVIEINTVESIKNSSNKLFMKRCFERNGVLTASHWLQGNHESLLEWAEDKYPIISKSHMGSRGEGNAKHDNRDALERFLNNHQIGNYIFEKYYTYNREYRLHVTKNGCFYTCRKVLKSDTPENQRWFRNDSNCNWLVESNESFDKPSNWNAIVTECVKALNAVGLDIGGFDVKVQSAQDSRGRRRDNPEFIIIESNSACSHGEITGEKYKLELNRLIRDKVYGRS